MAMTAWAAKFCTKRDLLVGKGTNFLTVQAEHTDQFVLFQHRHKQKRAYTPKFDTRNDCRIAFFSIDRLSGKIGDVNCPFVANIRPTGVLGLTRIGERYALQREQVAYYVSRRGAGHHRPSGRYFRSWHRRCARPSPAWPANTGCKIAGRAADDLEHLRRGRLLLQLTVVRSAVRWRSSFSSRAFSMAMTACAAKFSTNCDLLVGERMNLSTINSDHSNKFIIFEHRHNHDHVRMPASSTASTIMG